MNSRTVIAVLLGIFWFLYPPKAYAEDDSQQKTSPSDQPIKVKKKSTANYSI